MLPQNCSMIHYPISIKSFKRKNYNECTQKGIFYNSKNTFNICCFDYLIYLEEFYSDNLLINEFYSQFLKISYDFDKKGIFDFQNYSKEAILKFIIILNKVCCFYYIQDKIKYSKFLSNFSIRIIQNHLKKNKNNNNIKSNKKNSLYLFELKNNNIISTIYNNACCNYLKSFSYNKSLKFLEYSNKNVDENDINSKLIYYNNILIISTKNTINYNNIEYYIRILNKLILNKKKTFDIIYFNNNNYNNGGNNNGIIKNNLKKNEENYNNFKLLSFIMYNYCHALEKLLNQKTQAKKSYQNSYEFISKYLGKNSFEAQKFLFRLKSNKSKNQIQSRDNNYGPYYYNVTDENEMIDIENRRRNLTPTILRGKIANNYNNNNRNNDYDKDIELRLESIIKKIENFEEILCKKDMLNNIILKEKELNKSFAQNIDSNKYMINNSEDNITNSNNNLKFSSYDENINNNSTNKNEIITKDIAISENKNKNKINDNNKIKDINNNKNPIKIKEDKNNNIDNFDNKNNDENKKKNDTREKITFDMMENIIEEFKKESEEKLEQQKKLKEEKEKERKLKEEKEKREKENSNENKGMKIKIEKVDDKPNESQPKKVPRIKKLFQKVMGIREKEPPKTMLGELFQSLMKGPKEEKKKGMDDGGKEIKIGKEPDNNFINLDDEEDEVKDNFNNNNDKDIRKKEDIYGNINKNNNNKLNSKITINLDNSEYSYNATTFYQEINSSE